MARNQLSSLLGCLFGLCYLQGPRRPHSQTSAVGQTFTLRSFKERPLLIAKADQALWSGVCHYRTYSCSCRLFLPGTGSSLPHRAAGLLAWSAERPSRGSLSRDVKRMASSVKQGLPIRVSVRSTVRTVEVWYGSASRALRKRGSRWHGENGHALDDRPPPRA